MRGATTVLAALVPLLLACEETLSGPDRQPLEVPPPEILSAYEEDAARLAVRELARQGDPADAGVEIPPALRESLLNALLHVHAAAGLAARDSVVDLYRIHTFPDPPLHELLVAVEDDAPWAVAWRTARAT